MSERAIVEGERITALPVGRLWVRGQCRHDERCPDRARPRQLRPQAVVDGDTVHVGRVVAVRGCERHGVTAAHAGPHDSDPPGAVAAFAEKATGGLELFERPSLARDQGTPGGEGEPGASASSRGRGRRRGRRARPASPPHSAGRSSCRRAVDRDHAWPRPGALGHDQVSGHGSGLPSPRVRRSCAWSTPAADVAHAR